MSNQFNVRLDDDTFRMIDELISHYNIEMEVSRPSKTFIVKKAVRVLHKQLFPEKWGK